MRRPEFSCHLTMPPGWIQLVSLVLCCSLVSPCLAAMPLRTDAGMLHEKELSYIPSQQTRPARTPADGQRQISSGPYVPAALRPDNAERRAKGKDGKRVQAPPIKRGAPALNLPDLSQSRKIRKSAVTEAASTTASEKGVSSTSFQTEATPICGDCDPSGGGGASGTDPYFGTARTQPINLTGVPGVTLGSRNFNWSLPLVALPGRSGLDLSISLFYNSLVWTQQGNAIQYNADHGTPAPGFQI